MVEEAGICDETKAPGARMALCNAALRPSRTAWERFIAYLAQLEESGELSSDEVTALIASELTDRVLVNVGIDEDSDASSMSEVVERVKARTRR